jgi:hypothetical protein
MYNIIVLLFGSLTSAQVIPRADIITSMWIPGADQMPLVASAIGSVCLKRATKKGPYWLTQWTGFQRADLRRPMRSWD